MVVPSSRVSSFTIKPGTAEVVMEDPSPRENASKDGKRVNEPSSPETNLGATLVNSIRELLECPICYRAMYPPINQCSNGHTLCSSCKPKVQNRCPTCRNELGDIRSLALEKVAASLMSPCKYQSFGCVGVHPCHNKLEHESKCSFKPYNCPCANFKCAVVGNIPHLVAHLRDYHEVLMYDASSFSRWYTNTDERKNAIWNLRIFSCFGQFFCLHFEAFQLEKAPVYIAFLQFMGDENEARNYRYSLEVGGNGRKQIWEGVPRSIRDSHTMVRDSYDGLIIQERIALFFSDDGNKKLKLTVTGKIWKQE